VNFSSPTPAVPWLDFFAVADLLVSVTLDELAPEFDSLAFLHLSAHQIATRIRMSPPIPPTTAPAIVAVLLFFFGVGVVFRVGVEDEAPDEEVPDEMAPEEKAPCVVVAEVEAGNVKFPP